MIKAFDTIRICFIIFMARTFGEYLHSAMGDYYEEYARYRWRGYGVSIPMLRNKRRKT